MADKERRHLDAYRSIPDETPDEWGPPPGGRVAPDWSEVPWDGPGPDGPAVGPDQPSA
jgi:hypothetical protein